MLGPLHENVIIAFFWALLTAFYQTLNTAKVSELAQTRSIVLGPLHENIIIAFFFGRCCSLAARLRPRFSPESAILALPLSLLRPLLLSVHWRYKSAKMHRFDFRWNEHS